MRDRGLWTWHMASGVFILVLLGLHMTVMHLETAVGVFNPAGSSPIEWASVLERGRTLFFPASYVVLLGTALFHGLYGLRNILFELHPPRAVRAAISGLLLAGGLALFALGSWAAWAGHVLARGG